MSFILPLGQDTPTASAYGQSPRTDLNTYQRDSLADIRASHFFQTFSDGVGSSFAFNTPRNDKTPASPFSCESRITAALKEKQKNYNEAILIYKHLRHSQFFERFKQDNPNVRCTEALVHLCKLYEYHMYLPGAVIHRKGEPTNGRVYVVFSGKVNLYDGMETSKASKSLKETNQDEMTGSLTYSKDETASMMIASKTISNPKIEGLDSAHSINLDSFLNQKLPLIASKSQKNLRKFKGENTHGELTSSASIDLVQESLNIKKIGNFPPIDLNSAGRSPILHAKTYSESEKETPTTTLWREKTMITLSPTITSFEVTPSGIPKSSNHKDIVSVVESVNLETECSPATYRTTTERKPYSRFRVLAKQNSLENSSKKKSPLIQGLEHEEKEDEAVGEDLIVSKEASCEDMETNNLHKVLKKGDVFGDELFDVIGVKKADTNIRREYTAEVSEGLECEILSFKIEEYENLLRRYDRSNSKLMNFLLDHVPHLSKSFQYEDSRVFESIFTEKTLSWHQNLTVEGESGDKIYILFEGLCEVIKSYGSLLEAGTKTGSLTSLSSNNKDLSKLKDPVLCVLKPGVFIGEEILFHNKNQYDYTIKAAGTNVKVLEIKRTAFLRHLPHPVQKGIKELYHAKAKRNAERLVNSLQIAQKLSKDGILSEEQNKKGQEEVSKPVVKPLKLSILTAANTQMVMKPDEQSRSNRKLRRSISGKLNETDEKQIEAFDGEKVKGSISSRQTLGRETGKPSASDEYGGIEKIRLISTKEIRRRSPKTMLVKEPKEKTVKSETNLQTAIDHKKGILQKIRESIQDKEDLKFCFGKSLTPKITMVAAKEDEKDKENDYSLLRKIKKEQQEKRRIMNLSKTKSVKSLVLDVDAQNSSRCQTEFDKTNPQPSKNEFTSPKNYYFGLDFGKLEDINRQVSKANATPRGRRVKLIKNGKAFLPLDLNLAPLKSEERDLYPLITIRGAPMSIQGGYTKNFLI